MDALMVCVRCDKETVLIERGYFSGELLFRAMPLSNLDMTEYAETPEEALELIRSGLETMKNFKE